MYPPRTIILMTDLALITASTKGTLVEISKQASALGIGLQNAAPGDKAGMSNASVQYLLESSEGLVKIAEACNKILASIEHER